MAKAKKTVVKEIESITSGYYSTRTIHGDGRVDFVIDWDQLRTHIADALEDHHRNKLVDEAPFHPGYEGAIIEQPKPKKPKAARKKKA